MRLTKLAFFILLFGFSCSAIQAQKYQIFRTSGGVKMYHNKQWSPAQRRAPLSLSDSISIENGGFCTLLNTQTNQLFDIKKSGKYNVKKAIDATMRESSNIISQTTQNIANSVSSAGKSNNYNIYGATMRTDQATIQANQALANTLSKLVTDVQQNKLPKASKNLLLLCNDTDEVRQFSIQNNTEKPYVVNILRIPATGSPTFCINLDKTDSEFFFTLVAPQSTLMVSELSFGIDNATYVLVATTEIFDAAWVEQALSIPSNQKAPKKIKVEYSYIHE